MFNHLKQQYVKVKIMYTVTRNIKVRTGVGNLPFVNAFKIAISILPMYPNSDLEVYRKQQIHYLVFFISRFY